ncbi:MAG: MarR family transcriptional regulator [Ruminococcus sp.]|nr:MarR family transcriptional regulator [Ruminococcus sp.]
MEDKYEALKLKNQLCFPIYLCAKEIQRRYTPYLDRLNLTYTQYVVMMYFWEHGGSNVKAIGETLLLDPSTLTPLLKKLEAKGYVTRTRSKEDERNLIIELTESGEALKDQAVEIPAQMGKCLALSEDEATSLYKILYKVLLNIEKE